MGLEGPGPGCSSKQLLLEPAPAAPAWASAGFAPSAAWRVITTLWFLQT